MKAKNTSGFTLIEVAVAGALVALLSACAFRGIAVVEQNSRATAQRIAAQGACLNRYEELKAVAFENISEEFYPDRQVVLASMSKDPSRGLLMGTVHTAITNVVEDGAEFAMVDIKCTWMFRGRTRSEELHGLIANQYSTYAESGSLSTGDLELNPNFERPVMFYALATDGSVYTQSTLASMPASFEAVTIVMKPGGKQAQEISLGSESKHVSNDKIVSYIARDPGTPIMVNFARTTNPETNGTDYRISLSSEAVSFSYM
jgi:hypothetical protein